MAQSQRYLCKAISTDAFLLKKMAFISGPRQVGKTTLTKKFLNNFDNYFSYDEERTRRNWNKNPASLLATRSEGIVVLDEIYKDRHWKRKLKGLYDTIDMSLYYQIIVTGSAKLDLFRKKSDSLVGRYLPYRLHPFSVAESSSYQNNIVHNPDLIFQDYHNINFAWKDLLQLGGFPEPFLTGSTRHATRWSKLRQERLVQEDIRDMLNISDLRAFQTLIELLPERVGSQFSLNSLKEYAGKAYATIRSWYHVLEALYFCFSIKPYSKKIVRSLRAEPRIFLYDILRIPAELQSKKLENLCALHLLKACNYWTDLAQGEFELHYVRDKNQREVDFLIVKDGAPWMLIECKSGLKEPAKNLLYFADILKPKYRVQLISDNTYDKFYPAHHTRVMSYEKFFAQLV